ncbi:protein MULTIPOLAR SPINDLE 1 [Impatiens glandulifera]|uniref:protein MULTIPOLAR SPINDLE 1 n=1 Tax=Impatiens glandulifera TaxID=253017 RepID=UPI001FB06E38|nr:protein MULTIPOLAR SPINDLE 1 [Impatiens glandulifera]
MSSEQQPEQTANVDTSMKIALAIALIRSKLHKATPPSHPPVDQLPSTSKSDAEKWKRKAKERKQELLRLKNDIKEAQDDSTYDLFPPNATCKCYFFDNFGKLTTDRLEDDCRERYCDVLRRRFLRQVQSRERKRRRDDSTTRRLCYSDCNSEDEIEQLRASVDFLVEICGTDFPVKSSRFSSWSHQAVDFILVTIHFSYLIRFPLAENDLHHYVQHVIRKLGREPYIGQRVIFSVSQRISVLVESLLLMDPFDDAFPRIHCSMYTMIQLIEFLVSDYQRAWCDSEDIDIGLFEDWVTSVLHARKRLEILESRNSLYMIYMDRVIGNMAKQVSHTFAFQKLNPNVLDKLFI